MPEQPPINPPISDDDPENDAPVERRWVRASEVSALVRHMGRVIPGSEWDAAIPAAPTDDIYK